MVRLHVADLAGREGDGAVLRDGPNGGQRMHEQAPAEPAWWGDRRACPQQLRVFRWLRHF